MLQAIRTEGYTTPTAIQTKAIPHILDGKDILGCAQTGTGKTAAFALPILQRLHRGADAPRSGARSARKGGSRRPIRAMVITPTRELAAQIGQSFASYGRHTGLRQTVIFGGVKQAKQTKALRNGVDILVATPGRLLDLMNQGLVNLREVEIFVLDEADRMLDMGFIHDIRRVIAALPAERQTLLFSATIPRDIRKLAETLLDKPVMVKVAAESPAADTVQQGVYFIEPSGKGVLLTQLLQCPKMTRALVFTRTKRGADRLTRRLSRGEIVVEAIHSDKSQNARQRALASFKAGSTRVLVASDIAARGLDVDDISHVINYDLPNEAETYVHRIGRTGRAGAQGQAVSFCTNDQRDDLRVIERLLGRAIPVLSHSIKPSSAPAPTAPTSGSKTGAGARQRRRSARPGGATPAKRTAATPEQQQKTDSWRHKHKTRRPVTAGSKPRKRRR